MMHLHNTLTRQVEEFVPLNPPEVKIYSCGPTVYDYAHIGHLRKYSMDDVLVRTLQQLGYQVNCVQNVTDVGHLASDADTGEDKLEKGAKKYQADVWAVAKKFEDYFYYSMDLMNARRPDVVCRATDHISEMLDLVKTLEEKGYTYIIEGDGVYFDSSKFPDYPNLAQLDLEKLMEGARVEKVAGKRHPTDFALWKFERPGENRAMIWPSPWHERSFPGWHIECSAMSMKYLGEQLDIHTGGIDHIPVHHTNEIAQSEAATGKKPFARFWVHHNFLVVEGEKMSKSKENFYTIDDILEKGFEPMALRLLFLGAHYRSELNFTWQSLEAAQTGFNRLKAEMARLKGERIESGEGGQSRQIGEGEQVVLSTEGESLHSRFVQAMKADLNTPEAVAVQWQTVKSELGSTEKYQLLVEFDKYLGLGLAEIDGVEEESEQAPAPIDQLPTKVQELLKKRAAARQAKDYQQADQLRDELEQLGYRVVDQGEPQLVFKQQT